MEQGAAVAARGALVKGAAQLSVIFNHFPVAVDRVRRFPAPVVDYSAPHLQPEEGERENEENVQYQYIAELLEGEKQRRHEHPHRRKLRQASQWSEQSECSQRGHVRHARQVIN